jgi:hypothetical protein
VRVRAEQVPKPGGPGAGVVVVLAGVVLAGVVLVVVHEPSMPPEPCCSTSTTAGPAHLPLVRERRMG